MNPLPLLLLGALWIVMREKAGASAALPAEARAAGAVRVAPSPDSGLLIYYNAGGYVVGTGYEPGQFTGPEIQQGTWIE